MSSYGNQLLPVKIKRKKHKNHEGNYVSKPFKKTHSSLVCSKNIV